MASEESTIEQQRCQLLVTCAGASSPVNCASVAASSTSVHPTIDFHCCDGMSCEAAPLLCGGGGTECDLHHQETFDGLSSVKTDTPVVGSAGPRQCCSDTISLSALPWLKNFTARSENEAVRNGTKLDHQLVDHIVSTVAMALLDGGDPASSWNSGGQ